MCQIFSNLRISAVPLGIRQEVFVFPSHLPSHLIRQCHDLYLVQRTTYTTYLQWAHRELIKGYSRKTEPSPRKDSDTRKKNAILFPSYIRYTFLYPDIGSVHWITRGNIVSLLLLFFRAISTGQSQFPLQVNCSQLQNFSRTTLLCKSLMFTQQIGVLLFNPNSFRAIFRVVQIQLIAT